MIETINFLNSLKKDKKLKLITKEPTPHNTPAYTHPPKDRHFIEFSAMGNHHSSLYLYNSEGEIAYKVEFGDGDGGVIYGINDCIYSLIKILNLKTNE